jgi:hypothetical protein
MDFNNHATKHMKNNDCINISLNGGLTLSLLY